MASMASTSRVTLARTSVPSAITRRHMTSSARTCERHVVIAIANRTARFTLPSLSSILAPLLPATVESQQPALAGIPTMDETHGEAGSVLEWDGVLNAVPKSKVSHSRKAMRSANKGLKDRVDFVHCASCGKPKLAHHMCASCFSHINRAQKAVKREALEVEAKPVDVPTSN